MDTRREFIRKAGLLAGGKGLFGALPASIQKAMAIDPPPGTTWQDAEHIVILMQENRSFDHCYGNLKGVRGYRDPRAITLPDKNPVWLQTNAAGETYAPFRLDIKGTNATWMGSLPHSWTNQLDARNGGKYDGWLQAKHSGHPDYKGMPLTMGYYDRRDIPFYYSLADAFTVCDQNFCSSQTGTTPNRLHLWTGTIRDEQNVHSRPRVRNEDIDYGIPADWMTFPERLEDNDISWKIYQNETSLDLGFDEDHDAWLGNFGDSPIEFFSKYHVKFLPAYRRHLPVKIAAVTADIGKLEGQLAGASVTGEERAKAQKKLQELQTLLQTLREEQKIYTQENFDKLPQREKNLHEKAFCTNSGHPDYHELTSLEYEDEGVRRQLRIPKGDVLHQFREDVNKGKLPTVSWLVAPEHFSDHPSSAWYGAWYISETVDILTKNPEVWKKTIFILCYDENDGYFDHVPPFTAPHPDKPETGKVSAGIDAGLEHMTREQDLERSDQQEARAGSIGLGYRVPLVIASPWSRGGYVNSQVFDHTSILQFLEKFLSHRTGKKIEETNINSWRRTVCGDLTSVFRPYKGEKIGLPVFVDRTPFIESVHKAKFRQLPSSFRKLAKEEIEQFRHDPHASPLLPQQEKGTRPSCALPYQLYVNGKLTADHERFLIGMRVESVFPDGRAAGAPFIVYSHGKEVKVRDYAVKATDQLLDEFSLNEFGNGQYDLRVYGPNGFFRAFKGSGKDAPLTIEIFYELNKKFEPTGRIECKVLNTGDQPSPKIIFRDHAKKGDDQYKVLAKAGSPEMVSSFLPDINFGWYDISIFVEGDEFFEHRFAGRVETGKDGVSDPAMA